MSEAELFLSFFSFGPADALGSFFFRRQPRLCFFSSLDSLPSFFLRLPSFPCLCNRHEKTVPVPRDEDFTEFQLCFVDSERPFLFYEFSFVCKKTFLTIR